MRRLSPSLFVTLLLFLILCFFTETEYRAQGPSPPRNVRIVREGPGGLEDDIVARWNAPSDGNVEFYSIRHSEKPSDSPTWGDWSGYTTQSGRSSTIASVSSIAEGEKRDFQVEVAAYYNGSYSDDVRATRRNVGRTARRRRGSKSKDNEIGADTPPAPTPIPVKTCELLSDADSGIVVSSPGGGLERGTQCQQLDAAGIGIASIIEAGFSNAVDVWGNVREAQVCFEDASGSLLFLDAAAAPRTITPLQSISVEGMICAVINRPGSVVLIPSTTAESTTAESTTAESTTTVQVPIQAVQLENCKVTMNYILNLRDAPAGPKVLAWIPYLVRLDVSARTDEWFFVEWLGISGWVLAEFVYAQGNCG